MIIENCKHCEHYVTDACGDKVCAFDGDCENYVQTNEEYLKSCNTEELAEVLNKIFMTRTFCHICPEGGVCDIGYKCKYHGGNTKDFEEWLKEIHK